MLEKAKPGDRIEVVTKETNYLGRFMPSEDKGMITLKLDSGYNVGIKRSGITKAKVVQKYKPGKRKKSSGKKKDLPTISILHTGGTIASKVDYMTGGVTANFGPDELVEMFPEMREYANIESRLIRQMMSENMRFSHYNMMIEEVRKEVEKGVAGVIITHGTDTMHYSSAALAFGLENLPVPVILVGAQRSSDRGSSDAGINILSAVLFITKTDFADVAICMHEGMGDETCVILSGTKARKMHTSRRDAFRPINCLPIARVNFEKKSVSFIQNDYRKKADMKLQTKPFNENLKVGLLKSHTNMFAEEFLAFKDFDGLVIEGTALGQLPNTKIDEFTGEGEKITKALETLTRKMPVVMASQCIYGRIDMNVYAEGRKNIALGILGNYNDMTPETTFIKLAWLLSNHKEDLRDMIIKNIRGEISDRIEALESFL